MPVSAQVKTQPRLDKVAPFFRQGRRDTITITDEVRSTPKSCILSECDELLKESPITVLRETIVYRTYGLHKKLPGIYLQFFTNNIWSYLLRSPVIVDPISIHGK